jgi:hypothetical protein
MQRITEWLELCREQDLQPCGRLWVHVNTTADRQTDIMCETKLQGRQKHLRASTHCSVVSLEAEVICRDLLCVPWSMWPFTHRRSTSAEENTRESLPYSVCAHCNISSASKTSHIIMRGVRTNIWHNWKSAGFFFPAELVARCASLFLLIR